MLITDILQIADEFELFADPKISLEIHKAWGIAPDEPGFTLATTPQFKPFTCWVALAGDAPDAAAVKVSLYYFLSLTLDEGKAEKGRCKEEATDLPVISSDFLTPRKSIACEPAHFVCPAR